MFGFFHTALVHIDHVLLHLIAIAPEHDLRSSVLIEQSPGGGENV